MKTFFIILIFLITVLGCSRTNTFENFGFTQLQEQSEIYTQSSKIKKGTLVDGVVTVIYLNKVYPERYKDREYFYVSVYRKNKRNTIEFELNGLESSQKQVLKDTNEFRELIPSNTNWRENYLVVFEEQGDILHLVVKSGSFTSENLLYEKDE